PAEMRSWKRSFIIVWKVAGEFVDVENLCTASLLTRGSNSPQLVMNAALCLSPSQTQILLWPHLMSSLVKKRAPFSLSMSSETRGSG
ncbi:hypothetical protein B0H34DRAFT_668202, partial [Crassisporium funariophilum]